MPSNFRRTDPETRAKALAARRVVTPEEHDAIASKRNGDLGPLKALQAVARMMGRCGSLETQCELPCIKTPRPGFTACPAHGGQAPQTIKKAERLLIVARLPAIEALLDIVDQYNSETCAECGYPIHDVEEKRVIERVARTIFDRTGLPAKATIEVKDERKAEDMDLGLLTPAELAELDVLLAGMAALKVRVRDRLAQPAPLAIAEGTYVEGVVIPTPAEGDSNPTPGRPNGGPAAPDAGFRSPGE